MKNKDLIEALFIAAVRYTPFSYQIELIKDKSQKIIINKPRQVGVTTAFEFKYLIEAIKGKKTLVISKGYDEAVNVITECKTMYLRLFKKLNKNILIRDTVDFLQFESGGWIKALANTTESGRSYSVDNIFLDEFASYKNANELYNAVLPTISTKKEYHIAIASTPKGEGNLYYEIWKNSEKYGFKRYLIKIEQCPLFTPERINEIRTSMDELGFRQEYLNEFLGSANTYFLLDLIHSCVDKELTYHSTPETLEHKNSLIFGVDIGRKSDKTAIIGINQNGEVKYIETLNNAPFAVQREHLKQLLPYASVMYIDSNGIGMQLSEELSLISSKVMPIRIDNQLKIDGFIELRKMFEQREIKIPNNSELIRALNLIERKQSGTTITFDAARTDETGHSDLAFALMMVAFMSKQETGFQMASMGL